MTTKPNSANSQQFSLAINIFYYPFYRYFSGLRLTYLKDGFQPYMLEEAKSTIKSKGLYRGCLSFYFLNLFLSIIEGANSMRGVNYNFSYVGLSGFPLLIFNYPFLMNSIKRAMDFPDYTHLNNPKNVLRMIFTKSSYKGIEIYFLVSLITFMPFINLMSHRLEAARLASVFGHHYGRNLNFREAYSFFKTNNFLNAGRFSYNIPLHTYNFLLLGVFINTFNSQVTKLNLK
jgi:hypothetical protein